MSQIPNPKSLLQSVFISLLPRSISCPSSLASIISGGCAHFRRPSSVVADTYREGVAAAVSRVPCPVVRRRCFIFLSPFALSSPASQRSRFGFTSPASQCPIISIFFAAATAAARRRQRNSDMRDH